LSMMVWQLVWQPQKSSVPFDSCFGGGGDGQSPDAFTVISMPGFDFTEVEREEVYRDSNVVIHTTLDQRNKLGDIFHRSSFIVSSRHDSTASSEPLGDFIRYILRDFGNGIERKDFESIFKPFRQASADIESVSGGTGLGLTVTSNLWHSWEVRLHSTARRANGRNLQ
jgi:hypothetical protein